MEQPHIPVMLPEVLEYLSADGFEGKTFIDGTFGNGGYTRAILEQGANVLAVDRDPTAIANGQTLVDEMGGRLRLAHGPFSQLDEHAAAAGLERVDGVVLDIGVSSMQLDQAERGFSFRYDGPLDMRMALEGPSAADVVNSLDVKQLHRVIAALGEEKKAGSVARAIVSARGDAPITRTAQLASIVEKAVGVRPMDKIHPATRTFQALRIFVNRELEELAEALAAAERVLKEGGRLVVVVFHSLEDRIVKRFFRERAKTVSGGSRHLPQMEVPQPTLIEVTRKAVGASDAEAKVNPRSRSAKLRAAERTVETARDFDIAGLGVPIMPFSLTGLANSGANIGGRS